MPSVPDIKVAEKSYHCQCYNIGNQHGTGKSKFDDITDCVVTMLQAHADQETQYQGMTDNEHRKINLYIPEEIQ